MPYTDNSLYADNKQVELGICFMYIHRSFRSRTGCLQAAFAAPSLLRKTGIHFGATSSEAVDDRRSSWDCSEDLRGTARIRVNSSGMQFHVGYQKRRSSQCSRVQGATRTTSQQPHRVNRVHHTLRWYSLRLCSLTSKNSRCGAVGVSQLSPQQPKVRG